MPSSVIQWMQYRHRERTLDVAFRDGRGVYRYFDVPEAEWAAFLSSPSKGTYLNQIFKANGYGYEKLPPQEPEPAEVSLAAGGATEAFWGEQESATASESLRKAEKPPESRMPGAQREPKR